MCPAGRRHRQPPPFHHGDLHPPRYKPHCVNPSILTCNGGVFVLLLGMLREEQLLLAGPLGEQQLLHRSKARLCSTGTCRAGGGWEQQNHCLHGKGKRCEEPCPAHRNSSDLLGLNSRHQCLHNVPLLPPLVHQPCRKRCLSVCLYVFHIYICTVPIQNTYIMPNLRRWIGIKATPCFVVAAPQAISVETPAAARLVAVLCSGDKELLPLLTASPGSGVTPARVSRGILCPPSPCCTLAGEGGMRCRARGRQEPKAQRC